jgi:solute carrier family 35 protein F5
MGKFSFCGVFLVSLSDSSSAAPPHTSSPRPAANTMDMSSAIIGDALALLSAVFYALYVILLKVRVRSESRIDMRLFFGFVGLFNLLTCWPIGVILHLAKIERFEMPTSRNEIATIFFNVGCIVC